MAKIKLPKWLSEIWGKCNRGETVFRRFRKTIVVEANPSPSYTRTSAQDKVRKAYRTALIEWQKMSEEEREVWREKGRQLGLPAYQTYMKYRLLELLKIPFAYEITIDNTNNSNDLEDYQVLLKVENDSDFFSTVQDPKYMEFYDSDKTTLLNHYVEEWDDVNFNARIWIKIPLIPANATKKIYLKVNTSRTTDLSDPHSVFDVFDDFEDGVIPDDYKIKTTAYASVSEENGMLHIVTSSSEDKSGASVLIPYSNPKLPFIIETELKTTALYGAGEPGAYIGIADSDFEYHTYYAWPYYSTIEFGVMLYTSQGYYGRLREYADSTSPSAVFDTNSKTMAGVWWSIKAIVTQSQAIFKAVNENGEEINLSKSITLSAHDFAYIMLGKGDYQKSADTYFKYIRVRRYADPEPTVTYSKL